MASPNNFEMENQAEESLRDFQQRKRGFIRILSSESFGSYYLPFMLNRFSRAHPKIRVSMETLPTEMIVEKTATLANDSVSSPIPFPTRNWSPGKSWRTATRSLSLRNIPLP